MRRGAGQNNSRTFNHNKKSKRMTPEQQQSIVKTLQAALTTVEEKWNDKTESQAWMVGYLEGTIKRGSTEPHYYIQPKQKSMNHRINNYHSPNPIPTFGC